MSSSLASQVNFRQALTPDLPAIHDLIRASYAAMNEITGETLKEMWRTGAEKAIVSGDLVEESFSKEYLQTPGASFWVAELSGEVVGCVGLRRRGLHDVELCRMSVNAERRGYGIGEGLVKVLENHCSVNRIHRIHLITANTRAADFYAKRCGFCLTHGFTHSMSGITLSVAKMTKFLTEEPTRTVAIVGGTHGNERIGVELVSAFEKNPGIFQRPTLKVTAVLGNPVATAKNVRYVDQDLNRQFASTATEGIEVTRSRELLSMLGPKSVSIPSAVDFIIDLHSTTSDVGLVSMISASDYDPLALYVASKIGTKLEAAGVTAPHRITTTDGTKQDSWSVDSISHSGISFEVGPLSHGTLSYTLYDQTCKMVHAALDIIEERNQKLAAAAAGKSSSPSPSPTPAPASAFPLQEVFTQVKTVEYPDPAGGYCIHPALEGGNFQSLAHGAPAFISTLDSSSILPFAHPNAPPKEEGEKGKDDVITPELFTMFVGEASYRERNIAFAVYEKKIKPVLFSNCS